MSKPTAGPYKLMLYGDGDMKLESPIFILATLHGGYKTQPATTRLLEASWEMRELLARMTDALGECSVDQLGGKQGEPYQVYSQARDLLNRIEKDAADE